MNVMKTTLTTHEVAGLTFLSNEAVIRYLADMVPKGLFEGSRLLMNRGGIDYNAAVHMTAVDIAAYAVHTALDSRHWMQLLNAWNDKHQDEVKSYISRERKARAPEKARAPAGFNADILRHFFCDRPILIDVLRGHGRQDASKIGMRRMGDAVWIGTSTPHIVRLAELSNITTHALSQALRSVEGAERLGAKRFAKHASRAISVPVDALLAIIEVDSQQ